MQTQRIKVVRAFFFNREMQKPDVELELPRTLALELVAAGKATLVEPKPQKNLDLKQPEPAAQPSRASARSESAKQ